MQDKPGVPTKKFDAVLKDVKISKDRIRKKILSLNLAKSPGPDRVHPRPLKELAEIILEPLEKNVWSEPEEQQDARGMEKWRKFGHA